MNSDGQIIPSNSASAVSQYFNQAERMLLEQEENESEVTGCDDHGDYNRDVLLQKIVVGLNNDIKVALDADQ